MSTTQTGHIYMIYCLLNPDVKYIGSTMLGKPRDRWTIHKNHYRNPKVNCSIYKYFEQYGLENFKFQVLKSIKVCDQQHLKAYEQLYINKTRCVNQVSPLALLKDIKRKNYYQKYSSENREFIREKNRKYKEENPEKRKHTLTHYNNSEKGKSCQRKYQQSEKCKETKHAYYQNNIDVCKNKRKYQYQKEKELNKQKSRDYYQANKDNAEFKKKKNQYYEANKVKQLQQSKERYQIKKEFLEYLRIQI
jgi:hypothetical protein